jgi:hypothetical protein
MILKSGKFWVAYALTFALDTRWDGALTQKGKLKKLP